MIQWSSHFQPLSFLLFRRERSNEVDLSNHTITLSSLLLERLIIAGSTKITWGPWTTPLGFVRGRLAASNKAFRLQVPRESHFRRSESSMAQLHLDTNK